MYSARKHPASSRVRSCGREDVVATGPEVVAADSPQPVRVPLALADLIVWSEVTRVLCAYGLKSPCLRLNFEKPIMQ